MRKEEPSAALLPMRPLLIPSSLLSAPRDVCSAPTLTLSGWTAGRSHWRAASASGSRVPLCSVPGLAVSLLLREEKAKNVSQY